MKKIYDETEEGRRGKNRLMAAATPSSCVCLYMYSRKRRKEAKERKKKNFFSQKRKDVIKRWRRVKRRGGEVFLCVCPDTSDKVETQYPR